MTSTLRSRDGPSSFSSSLSVTTQQKGTSNGVTSGSSLSKGHKEIRELWRLPFFSYDPTRSQLMYLCFASFYLFVAYYVIHYDALLPTPKPSSILMSEFSEIRAREHLYAMSSHGVRNTGEAATEVFAARYIVGQLAKVRSELPKGFHLDIDVQRPSGYFDLNFLGGFTSSYQNVTNILARLWYSSPRDRHNRTDVSFLVSAHFDSAMRSPAASDDLANIASMLEIVRNLAHSPPLPHAVIFNFNGAEESILQAAHGFITQHPWRESIGAFLNGEGAGGAGRELTFQLGPSNAWLAFMYARSAPYPFASSVAQDIFQSGIVPSDTDFRVYRDYGGLAGIDMAYITDGWVYHTPLDDVAHVPAGAMQRAGENILALTIDIASSPQLFYAHPRNRHLCLEQPAAHQTFMEHLSSHKVDFVSTRREAQHQAHERALDDSVESGGTFGDAESFAKADVDHLENYRCDKNDFSSYAVFFDTVGTFAVIYSSRTAFWINSFALCFSTLYLVYQHNIGPYYVPKRTALSLLLLITGWLLALAVNVTIAGLLILLGHTMKWFAYPILSVGLYVLPTVLVSFSFQRELVPGILFRSFASKEKPHVSVWIREEQCFLTALALWIIFLGVFFYMDVPSALIFTLLSTLPTVGRIVGRALDRLLMSHLIERHQEHTWFFLLSYMFSILGPVLLVSYASYVVLYFFMPIMGRSGDTIPSEVVIAVLISVTTLVITTLPMSLVHLDKGFLLRKPLVMICALSFAIALCLPSYTPHHPKRIILAHVHRHWYMPLNVSELTFSTPHSVTDVNREDSGLWISGMDWQKLKPIRPVRLNRATKHGLSEDVFATAEELPCEGIYCSLPWYYPIVDLVHGSWLIPSEPLSLRYRGRLILEHVEYFHSTGNRNHRRYHFSSVGAHHQTLFINNVGKDELGAELIRWSFHNNNEDQNASNLLDLNLSNSKSNTIPFSLGPFYDAESVSDKAIRREYFVFFSSGAPDWTSHSKSSEHLPSHYLEPVPTLPEDLEGLLPTLDTLQAYNERKWSFWLEVRDNPDVINTAKDDGASMPLQFCIASHYQSESTPVLDAVVEDMPDWTTVVHWVAKWDEFLFK